MSTVGVLHKLSNLLLPGTKLDKISAIKLAAELRKYASQLDDYESIENTSRHCHRARKKPKRQFDFSRYQQRYIALNLSYIGWTFRGFAAQDHEENTIEGHLFRALRRVCLVPEDASWEDMKYSRCGRTDIGVSASGQTVALMIRSNAKNDGSALPDVSSELDYPLLLNRVLPRHIKVLGWTPVEADFHARYSAQYREYKYFIAGARSLNVSAMQSAAKAMEGVHDFSNLCRMNLQNSTQHVRHITLADVQASPDQVDIVVFTVRGTAFIWNQVRCMAAVLIMVGRELEAPGVMNELLDVEQNPGKPQYQMASDVPLLLHRTGFDRQLNFINSAACASDLVTELDSQKADLTERLALVNALHERVIDACECHLPVKRRMDPPHTPLMLRAKDPSFAERLLAFQHKQARAASCSKLTLGDEEDYG